MGSSLPQLAFSWAAWHLATPDLYPSSHSTPRQTYIFEKVQRSSCQEAPGPLQPAGSVTEVVSLEKKEPVLTMVLPLLILAGLAVALGVFPGVLTDYLGQLIAAVLG